MNTRHIILALATCLALLGCKTEAGTDPRADAAPPLGRAAVARADATNPLYWPEGEYTPQSKIPAPAIRMTDRLTFSGGGPMRPPGSSADLRGQHVAVDRIQPWLPALPDGGPPQQHQPVQIDGCTIRAFAHGAVIGGLPADAPAGAVPARIVIDRSTLDRAIQLGPNVELRDVTFVDAGQ